MATSLMDEIKVYGGTLQPWQVEFVERYLLAPKTYHAVLLTPRRRFVGPGPQRPNPATTLRLAASLIRERGWRSRIYVDAYKRGYCAVGAIAQVTGFDVRRHTITGYGNERALTAAMQLLGRRLGCGRHPEYYQSLQYGWDEITDWNDGAGKAAVLAVLDPR